jgi:aspartyl protease family protein
VFKTALWFAAAAFALAFYAPDVLLRLQPANSLPAPRADVVTGVPQSISSRVGPHEQSIAADAGGQYSLDVLVAGQSVHMLVDTGATMVVISAQLADRIGLSVESGKKWRMHTANGDTLATETTLATLDLGSIYMTNVPALIADRSAGDINLLGASFLRRLASVEQRNGMLFLRQ